MITTAFVKMWGKTIGAVSYDAATGLAAFEYDKSFARTGINPAPLKMLYCGKYATNEFI